jgi:hypothetical protein
MDIEAIEHLVGFLQRTQVCDEELGELIEALRTRASFAGEGDALAKAIEDVMVAIVYVEAARKNIVSHLKLELGK